MTAMSTPYTLATPPRTGSPFGLDDERAWRDWRARKLAGYPASAADLVVEVTDPRALTRSEHAALAARCRAANMVIYASADTSAVAMATPIAHKGVTAGAKAQALTMVDLLLRPELVVQAWEYFNTVQTKDVKYQPLIRPDDPPATWMNQGVMERFRPEMKKFYYDPAKYKTYLEQLGVTYPTLKPAAPSASR